MTRAGSLAFFIGALLSMVGCHRSSGAAPSAVQSSTIQGTGFSFPMPANWARRTDLPGTGGETVAMFAPSRVGPDYFLGSVVVGPIEPSNPPLNPADPATCRAVGEGLAHPPETTLERAEIVTSSQGQTCQVRTRSQAHAGHRAGMLTVMHGPRDWSVVCNYDDRDPEALAACTAALAGWRFGG